MAARPDPLAAFLRPMDEGDIGTVLSIEHASYPFPWSEGMFRDSLRTGYCCWVAENLSGPVGYFILSVGAGEAHLLNLCVAPAFQRQGLGRRMLRQALRLARDHGSGSVYLEVRPSNEAAAELYRRSGFAEIGTRRGYYPLGDGRREDAIVLALTL